MSEVTTTAQRWQRVKSILADALEHPASEDRAAYLERSCAGDTMLMREVEELLALSTKDLDELADNTPIGFKHPAPAQPVARRIGAYAIVREIGRGGMGAVYLAERADGQFEKEVAIKLLKRGTDTDEILRRFHAERRILARLDHPNIARLLDAGTTDDGLPYFVMEYIGGVPITSYVRQKQLSIAQRLELFLKVCEAVQFAHEHRVVHRDLKPGNIFVRQDGETKLLDFGIAKLLTSENDAIELTLTAERRFTPICASPEQARGETVTPSSDVYALGALLYEILTDRPPHRFSTPHPSPAEVAHVIGEQEPIRPSLSIHDNQVRRQLRGDLDNIVLTALRKEPVRRYLSVAEFAEDIRRHIEGRAIRARPNTLAYVSRRFLGRQKYRISALMIVVALGTAFGIILFSYQAELKRRPSFSNSQTSSAIADKSIAVLPFENLSDDKANSYFAGGIQDELITDLAQVAELKVISRASVAQYTGPAARNLREIARELGVAHLLAGTVQRSGNRIRVNAQLINAGTEAHEWVQQYDRDVSDLFAIQSEIARSIVAQLQARISPNEMNAITQQPTTDLVAYDLYLRANALMDEIATSTDWEGDNRRAIDLLDRAVTHDPKFAAAYAKLCDFHLNLYDWVEHTPQRLAQAETATQEAIRLAPSTALTYLAQADFVARQRKWSESLEFLQSAQKLQPGNAKLLIRIALAEDHLGQSREAVRNLEKARELAPRDPNIPNHLDWMYTGFRDYRKSDEVADAAITNFPNGPNYYRAQKVLNALHRGDWKEATRRLALIPEKFDPSGFRSLLRLKIPFGERDFAEFERVLASIPRNNLIGIMDRDVVFMEAVLAEKQDDRAKMGSILNAFRIKLEAELRAEGPDKGPSYHPLQIANLALVHCYLGQMDDALRESQQAIELAPKTVDLMKWAPDALVRAEILMRADQPDHAIHLLEEVVKVPYGPTYGELLGLQWDRLRGDPRFAQILEEAARPVDLMSIEDKKDTEPAILEKSIAVLPFENLSDDSGHAYFTDGIQEDIQTSLAKIADLKVTSRASVARYRESTRNIREIGRALQVAHVLEGNVQKTQGHLRVYARLTDTRSGVQLWAEQYDRALDDLFAIQNEITRSIVEQMKAALSPQEKALMQEKPTKDMVAYDLYLQAREIDRNSFNGMGETTREIVLLDEATKRDPAFVAALCLLARSHLDLYWLNLDHTPTRLLLAKKALEAAATSQPDAGEVHLARAILYYWGSRDYRPALAELAIARRQLPNELDVLVFTVGIEKREGHWEEARRVCEQAIALDPLNPSSLRDFARSIYVSMRLYAEAGKLLDTVLSWKPNEFGLQRERARIDIASKADLGRLESVVSGESARTADPNLVAATRLEVALWRRDYAAAERALADYRLEDFNAGGFITPRQWYEGIIARSREDKDAAQNAFTLAHERVAATVRNRPDDAKALSMLAQIDAALGQKKEAITEGRRAMELLPVSKDAADGPTILGSMASVYAQLGETKTALDLLESCAALPNGPDYGSLTLDQKWDPLRSDPRFDKIVASLASSR